MFLLYGLQTCKIPGSCGVSYLVSGSTWKANRKTQHPVQPHTFSGFGLVGGNSLVGSCSDRVRSRVLRPFLLFSFPLPPIGVSYTRTLSSVALTEPGALSSAIEVGACEKCFVGTLYAPVSWGSLREALLRMQACSRTGMAPVCAEGGPRRHGVRQPVECAWLYQRSLCDKKVPLLLCLTTVSSSDGRAVGVIYASCPRCGG